MPNEIIIDANIVISVLLRSRITLGIMALSAEHLHAPHFIVDEIRNNKEMICEKSRCSQEEFEANLKFLLRFTNLIDYSAYKDFLPRAIQALGAEHPGDVHYLACALAINADFIWTNDRDFYRQNLVPAKTTSRMLARMKIFKYLDHLISSGLREGDKNGA